MAVVFPGGKSRIYAMASRIRNLSGSAQAPALSLLSHLRGLFGQIKAFVLFFQGQRSILLYSLYSAQLVEGI